MTFNKHKNSTGIYVLNYRARCLAAQSGETKHNNYFIGSHTLHEKNQIHHVQISESANMEVTRLALYNHQHEIWYITASPHDKDLLITAFNTGTTFKGALWKINEQTGKIEHLENLGLVTGSIKRVLWDPSESDEAHNIAYLDDNSFHIWDLNTEKETNLVQIKDINGKITSGCWNPYFQENITISVGDSIVGFDIRTKTPTFTIKNAHQFAARDVDINPNNPYIFVSGGDDGKIKFWDHKNLDKPVLTFSDHSHWIWNVKYNKFDSLVLSSSSDGTVNLWNIDSLAFKNRTHENPKGLTNKLLKSYQDHDDSVYSIAWSASEEVWNWATFASLSYDGRVVINRVPEEDARRILAF